VTLLAKKGITLGLTVTERDGKIFVRKAHNAGNSHNADRQACMKRALTGQRGGGKEAQQARFRQASAQCR
jgi:hypothetical protein